jgi:hypothetical protein
LVLRRAKSHCRLERDTTPHRADVGLIRRRFSRRRGAGPAQRRCAARSPRSSC